MSSVVAQVLPPPASPPRARTAPAGGGGGGSGLAGKRLSGLDEKAYRAVVLHLTDSKSEADIDSELAARAAALGISTALSRPASVAAQKPSANTSCAESAITVATGGHARSFSTGSNATASTALTSHSSIRDLKADGVIVDVIRKRTSRLSFSQYDKYLANVDLDLKQPKLDRLNTSDSSPSIFSSKSKKGYTNFRRSLERVSWLRKRSTDISERSSMSCICCREDFKPDQILHHVPCGHTYCSSCLHVLINQSCADESKMPPRCCTQPIPATIVKSILNADEKNAFLKAVVEFSVPWEARIFCPNMTCSEFIPPRSKIDPKRPSEVVCRKCRTRVCVMCKKQAHPFGQDCPGDWELDAVLKMGEKSGWRRCYKCRSLVELTDGCTHMTCRCKAEFCYICGAVWDGTTLGCPNYCDGEGELERRRQEEAARTAKMEAMKEVEAKVAAKAEEERKQAVERTASSDEFKALRADQEQEMSRFRMFERKTKWVQWSRHSQTKSAMVDEFTNRMEKMKERHLKTAQQLEDRQVAAEMELRTTLEQSERSVRIRLKHMEAYCDALGRGQDQGRAEAGMPPRTVTERDLRELGQQYNLRDGMERLHQARINVLRDQQAKRMEELLERQEQEMETLLETRTQSIQDLEADFVQDEEALTRLFEDRKNALYRRWELAGEIMRKELEQENGVSYGPMQLPEWPPAIEEVFDEGGIDDPMTTEDED